MLQIAPFPSSGAEVIMTIITLKITSISCMGTKVKYCGTANRSQKFCLHCVCAPLSETPLHVTQPVRIAGQTEATGPFPREARSGSPQKMQTHNLVSPAPGFLDSPLSFASSSLSHFQFRASRLDGVRVPMQPFCFSLSL